MTINALFMILLLLAAVCFIVSTVTMYRTSTSTGTHGTSNRYNLVALGLFFLVLVPLVQQIRAL